MKLKCDRKQLNTLLSLAKKAVPSRTIIPETACVLLSAQNGVLSIKSTDTLIAFSLQMDAEMSGEGALCVPAETLSGIVSNLKEEQVTLELLDTTLKVTSGKAKATVKSLPADDFPLMPIAKTKICTIPSVLMMKINTLFVPFVVQDESSSVLQGVFMSHKDKELRIVTSNRYQTSYFHQESTAENFEINIPARGKSILRECHGDTEMWIAENSGVVVLKTEDGDFASTLLENNFPDAKAAFERMDATPVSFASVGAGELLSAVRLAAVMSNNVNHRVGLAISKDTILVTSSEAETGDSEHSAPCELTGEPFSVKLNSDYLCQILEPLKGLDILIKYSVTVPFVAVSIAGKDDFVHGVGLLS